MRCFPALRSMIAAAPTTVAPAKRGGEDNIGPEGPDSIGDGGAARFGLRRMLQHQRALQVAGTVQSRRQPEVSFEQRARPPKPIEHGIRSHNVIIRSSICHERESEHRAMRMTSIRTAILTLTIGAIGAAPVLAQTPAPQVQDLAVALARSAWVPNFTTVVQGTNTSTPNSGFLSGATTGERKTTTG